MKKFMQILACLYAGIAAVNAEDITFDGNTIIQGHDYITFDIDDTSNDVIKINKVTINAVTLPQALEKGKDFKEITLIIPGKAQGKHISIGEGAFSHLNARQLKLNVKFQSVNDGVDSSDVTLPTDCTNLFSGSESITGIDLSGVGSSQVTAVQAMFSGCKNLENITFGDNFNTATEINSMKQMFYNCENLKNLDLSKFDATNVKNVAWMFKGCKKLETLKLNSNLKLQYTQPKGRSRPLTPKSSIDRAFAGCESLNDIPGLNVDTVDTEKLKTEKVFDNCPAGNQFLN